MISNLTRKLSIGFSSKGALREETTLFKSWRLEFQNAGRTHDEALIVLLLEGAEPLLQEHGLLVQVYEAVRKGLGRDLLKRGMVKARMERAIETANAFVLAKLANASDALSPRISVLLAVFMPSGDAGYDVMIGHVGACRAFRRHKQEITPLTTPHTWGQENVTGELISADDEENTSKYPYWRRPTRFLGATRTVKVDFGRETNGTPASVNGDAEAVKLQHGDNILLCTSTLTATGLQQRGKRITARAPLVLAEQLTTQAALPGGDGAAAVVVDWSNRVGAMPLAVTVLLLAVVLALAMLMWQMPGVSPFAIPTPSGTAESSPIAENSAVSIGTIVELSPSVSETRIPIEDASSILTGIATPTSTMWLASVTPTALRAPTTTTMPTNTPSPTTPTPTAPPTPTPTVTVTPTLPIDALVAADYSVTLLMPSPDLTVGEQNKTIQFAWSSSPELPVGFEYELVFWFDGMNPETQGQAPRGSGRDTSKSVTFPVRLFDRLITNEDVCWGIRRWPVEAEPNTRKIMLSNGCRVLKIRLESEIPDDPGPGTQGDTGGTPCVINCN